MSIYALNSKGNIVCKEGNAGKEQFFLSSQCLKSFLFQSG